MHFYVTNPVVMLVHVLSALCSSTLTNAEAWLLVTALVT